jgi:hypothetical protein
MSTATEASSQFSFDIPPGIRRSQEAFWRDLPELLQIPKHRDNWVAYEGDKRIGIAHSKTELVREIIRRGIARDVYYIGIIQPQDLAPWEPEEIEPRHPRLL